MVTSSGGCGVAAGRAHSGANTMADGSKNVRRGAAVRLAAPRTRSRAGGRPPAGPRARPAAPVRIGVISDNHGYLDPEVLEIFAGVTHIIHGRRHHGPRDPHGPRAHRSGDRRRRQPGLGASRRTVAARGDRRGRRHQVRGRAQAQAPILSSSVSRPARSPSAASLGVQTCVVSGSPPHPDGRLDRRRAAPQSGHGELPGRRGRRAHGRHRRAGARRSRRPLRSPRRRPLEEATDQR